MPGRPGTHLAPKLGRTRSWDRYYNASGREQASVAWLAQEDTKRLSYYNTHLLLTKQHYEDETILTTVQHAFRCLKSNSPRVQYSSVVHNYVTQYHTRTQ